MFDSSEAERPMTTIRRLLCDGKSIECIAEHTIGRVVDSLVFAGTKAIRIGATVYELPNVS
jgi:hypothetical protein